MLEKKYLSNGFEYFLHPWLTVKPNVWTECLTSAFISEVWEEDMFLRKDKQSQSASSQGVVIHSTWVGQNLPALIHHHPEMETQH